MLIKSKLFTHRSKNNPIGCSVQDIYNYKFLILIEIFTALSISSIFLQHFCNLFVLKSKLDIYKISIFLSYKELRNEKF